MTIDLYYGFPPLSPPSRAVLMTAKQLSIDVNIKSINLSKDEQLEPQFVKLNPAHTVPTIVDGDLVLWESRAIMQYLVNKYAPNSPLYPTDPKKRAIIDRTLNTDQTMYQLLCDVVVNKLFRGRDPTKEQIIDIKSNLKLLETLIGDHKYLTGDELTIADISVLASHSIPIILFNEFKNLNDWPKLKAWIGRLQKELPYYYEINGQLAQTLNEYLIAKK